MADFTNKPVVGTLHVPETLTVADGKCFWKAEWDFILAHAQGTMTVTGTTSGANVIQLRNVTDGEDLLSTAISIAYNASPKVAVGVVDEDYQAIDKGDVIGLDVDAVAGGTPAGLTVNFYGIAR